MRGGRVLAIAGAKGGVGKTTTSLNLAAALAADREVVVVETDLVMANATDFVDLPDDAGATLHEVLAGEAPPADAVHAAPGGFALLPSGTSLEGYAATRPDRLPAVVDALREDYGVVLLDTGAGVSQETLLPMGLADATLLVSTPRLASVRDARKTAALVERVGGSVAGIVFAKSGTGAAPEPERIARALDVDLLGHVPEDDSVPASQDAGVPLTVYDPSSPAARSYHRIANALPAVGGRTAGSDARPGDDPAAGSPFAADGNGDGDGDGPRGSTGNGDRPAERNRDGTGRDRSRRDDHGDRDGRDEGPLTGGPR